MKPASNSSPLDSFIRNSLKSADTNIPPFDWSEVEVLLKHEPRSMSVGASKKTILIAVAVAGVLLLTFGVFKIAEYYSNEAAETETSTDSTQNSFDLIDTANAAHATLPPHFPKIDSAAISLEKFKSDSIRAVIIADSIRKINIKEPVVKTIQKQDRKKRPDTTQKAVADTTSPKPNPIIPDTPPEPPVKEIIIETPLVPDTTTKNSAPNNSSKKRRKSKNSVPPPPAETKPDSLK